MNTVLLLALIIIMGLGNLVLIFILLKKYLENRVDRRKYLRMPVHIIPARFFIEGEADVLLENKSIIKNVSSIGLALETDFILKRGAKVFISFKLPGSERYVESRGRIIWVGRDFHEKVAGIKFLKLHNHDKAFIKEFLESRSKH